MGNHHRLQILLLPVIVVLVDILILNKMRFQPGEHFTAQTQQEFRVACTDEAGGPTVHLRDLLQRYDIATFSSFLGLHCVNEKQCRSDIVQRHFSSSEHGSYLVAPNYKLLMCYNYKVMSRQVIAFMTKLTDHNNTQDLTNRTISPIVLTNESQPSIKTIAYDPQWDKIIVVRDPMERALSGYLNKCAKDKDSPGCGPSSPLGRRLPPKHQRTFRDFVHALESFTNVNQFDGHWKPQSYACMKSPNDDFQVISMSYRGWQDRLDGILQRHGVPSDLTKILIGQSFSVNPHYTNATDKVVQHYDADLVLRVLRLYSADYITYGLRLPGMIDIL